MIVVGVFAIKWFKTRKDKNGERYKRNKKRALISLIIMVICFIGAGIAQSFVDKQEQAAIEARDKKKYKDDKKTFIAGYSVLGCSVEDLSSKEGNEWKDAIDNSGEDFDVDSTIDNIEKKHSEDISTATKLLDRLHELDQKIQNNTYASDSDKKTIHSSYLSMKHFTDHATDISGSYDDFTNEHNKMDRSVGDKLEELKDM